MNLKNLRLQIPLRVQKFPEELQAVLRCEAREKAKSLKPSQLEERGLLSATPVTVVVGADILNAAGKRGTESPRFALYD